MNLSDRFPFELLAESRRSALELIDSFTFDERPSLDLAPLRAVILEISSELDMIRSLKQFRDNLVAILGDVDHILMGISTTSATDEIGHDLSAPEAPVATQLADIGVSPAALTVVTRNGNATMQNVVLERVRMATKLGFPAHIYRAPAIMTLTSSEGRYIGGIALFRELTASPISDSTLRLAERLRPIFEQMIIHFIIRYRSEHETQLSVNRAAKEIMERFALSRSESRVLLLLLYGCSYTEIANDLGVTINTVRKHVKSIHAKTSTSSTIDIYARFIARRYA